MNKGSFSVAKDYREMIEKGEIKTDPIKKCGVTGFRLIFCPHCEKLMGRCQIASEYDGRVTNGYSCFGCSKVYDMPNLELISTIWAICSL